MELTAQSVREQVAWACRILALEGYADLTLGHVSARPAGSETIYIKRKGVALDEVEPDDVVDLEDPNAHLHLETVLHTEIYARRPDVGAVVHGHSPYVTAFGATKARLELLTHDAVLFAGGISVFDETAELITERDQGRAVAEALGTRRVVILRNHGVVVADKDVPWAVLSAVTLERAIRLQAIASTLGELRPIPKEHAEGMFADKYQERFLAEYWAAWIRRARRAGADWGMPPE
ncbi:MAG TPA: class II aldolase/adducin family protein [Gaiellaceae bacterium]|nr:class II aldolase/adducin family protein [Gaiellaceae bacterium]